MKPVHPSIDSFLAGRGTEEELTNFWNTTDRPELMLLLAQRLGVARPLLAMTMASLARTIRRKTPDSKKADAIKVIHLVERFARTGNPVSEAKLRRRVRDAGQEAYFGAGPAGLAYSYLASATLLSEPDHTKDFVRYTLRALGDGAPKPEHTSHLLRRIRAMLPASVITASYCSYSAEETIAA